MKVYEIKYLDCKKLKNRQRLLREIMKVTKTDEKPKESYLEKFAKSVGKKYGMPIQLIKQMESKMVVSIRVTQDSYSVFEAISYYELLCKYILLINEFRKMKMHR